MGRKWGGSERAEASVELWTQGALRHKKHSPYGTFQAPRCVHTAHFELCKSFYQIKTNWTHYIISLFEKIKNNFLYFWWTTFLFADVSAPFKMTLFYHSEDFYRRYSRTFWTQTFYIGSTCSSYCFIENYTQGNMMKSLNKIK